MPDTVYLIGSNLYGEQPCNTNGVGCGDGSVERPRGALLRHRRRSRRRGDGHGAACARSPTCRTTRRSTTRPWCAYAPYFDNGCVNAPNGIHPDQHVIGINPGNPTQIFEGSDGGMIRTSGSFADASSQCDEAAPQRRRPDDRRRPRHVHAAPVPGADDARAHRQEAEQHAPVHQRRDQPVQHVRGHGRHAGQRHVVEPQRLRQQHVDPGHLRRRRQRRLRRDEPDAGASTSSRAGSATRTSTTAIRRSGSSPRPPSHAAAKARRSTGRRSPTRTRPPERTRSTRARSTSGGRGRSARATPGAVPQDTTPDIALYEANCPEFVTSGVPRTGAATTGRSAGRSATGSRARRRSRPASTSPAT